MKEVPATYMYSCLYEFTMPDVKETPKNKLMQYFTVFHCIHTKRRVHLVHNYINYIFKYIPSIDVYRFYRTVLKRMNL